MINKKCNYKLRNHQGTAHFVIKRIKSFIVIMYENQIMENPKRLRSVIYVLKRSGWKKKLKNGCHQE